MKKMSKTLVLPLLLIVLMGTRLSLGEQRLNGGFGLNLLGGFSSTNHEQVALGGVESQMGLSFGLGLEFSVLPTVSVEIDILNAQKSFQFLPLGGGTKESYYLTYLETPVLIKWLLSKNFNLKAGPYLSGLMISATKEAGGATSSVKSEFKNDYGITFGAWFGFQTKKNLLIGLDIRYDLGMADIRNDSVADNHLYTRTLMGLLNFTFLFK
ncbi:MAG: hypothetical protein EBQ92_03255 [Proteobacteria bacterium]|nr:hypothetical protein [Pseudomonadota bacterium]